MARKKTPPPLTLTSILDDDVVEVLARGVAAMLGPEAMALAGQYGVRPEDVVRALALGKRCTQAREEMGLDQREAAKRLGVPRYKIDDIERIRLKSIQADILKKYIEFLGITAWYEEWAGRNPEIAARLESGGEKQADTGDEVRFRGEILAVKARIRLIRSFDQISHAYQGYTLVIGAPGGDPVRVAVGPAAHAKHQFRIGDVVSGKAHPVSDPRQEWATLYKASGLKVERRGPAEQDRPADPEGGIAPPLEVYRERGHRRLDPRTCAASCARCPWGLTMATEIIVDHWKPWIKRWRTETHCYGPRDCPRYRSGAARKVPGRTPGMVWVDNDVEREAEE